MNLSMGADLLPESGVAEKISRDKAITRTASFISKVIYSDIVWSVVLGYVGLHL